MQQTHFNPIGASTALDNNFSYPAQNTQNFNAPLIQPIVNKVTQTTATTSNLNINASLSATSSQQPPLLTSNTPLIPTTVNTSIPVLTPAKIPNMVNEAGLSKSSQQQTNIEKIQPVIASNLVVGQTFANVIVDAVNNNENFGTNSLLISNNAEQNNFITASNPTPTQTTTTTTTNTTNPAVKPVQVNILNPTNSQIPLNPQQSTYQTQQQQQQTLNVNITTNPVQNQTGFNQSSPKDQIQTVSSTKTVQPPPTQQQQQTQSQINNPVTSTSTNSFVVPLLNNPTPATSTGIIDQTTATIKELIGESDFNNENEKKFEM